MAQDVILLVEDNPDEAYLATLALADVHADVVHAHDGAEALDYLRTHDAPVVVLLDLKLPKVTGIEVLRALKAEPRTSMIPVVILTNSLDEGDVAAAYASGCNSYVRKQVDWVEFKETIRQVGAYWVQLNQKLPRAAPGRVVS